MLSSSAARPTTPAQKYADLQASNTRMQEQMTALQRKLVNVVDENEALTHVVDKLQCHVLSLRRQLQAAGLQPEMHLDEQLLRPGSHKVTGGWRWSQLQPPRVL
jgi:predicted  nucleic acid-binding Zn-ribbon protein